MNNLNNKRILLTGPNSMVGKAMIPILLDRGAIVIPITHQDYDLVRYDQSMRAFDQEANYCIHLASYNGNPDFLRKNAADVFQRTSLINLNVLTACRVYNIEKVVSVLASCAYPSDIDILKEEDLWLGKCHDSVEPHGSSKRILDVYSRCLRKQYNLNAVTCILNNVIGEEDSTDLNKTKVVLSFIKKYCDAKKLGLSQVVNWGRGLEKRQFIYVKDAAEAIIQMLEKYDGTYPINLASPTEISIKDLATKISKMVGYTGITEWDATKPDGQMRKFLDLTKMAQYLDVQFTDFDTALLNVINWYKSILGDN